MSTKVVNIVGADRVNAPAVHQKMTTFLKNKGDTKIDLGLYRSGTDEWNLYQTQDQFAEFFNVIVVNAADKDHRQQLEQLISSIQTVCPTRENQIMVVVLNPESKFDTKELNLWKLLSDTLYYEMSGSNDQDILQGLYQRVMVEKYNVLERIINQIQKELMSDHNRLKMDFFGSRLLKFKRKNDTTYHTKRVPKWVKDIERICQKYKISDDQSVITQAGEKIAKIIDNKALLTNDTRWNRFLKWLREFLSKMGLGPRQEQRVKQAEFYRELKDTLGCS